MSRKFVPLTPEEIDQAFHTDIVSFLKSHGEEVKHSGTEWYWVKHDSVKIRGHLWYRHSVQFGGSAIAFLQVFYNMHFVSAVQTLLDPAKKLPPSSNCPNFRLTEKPTMVLPGRNTSAARAFAYLCKQRRLSPDVVSFFMKIGLIYESSHHHNVVFVGKDRNQCIKHCTLKGSLSDRPFQGDITGSDKRYSFNYITRSTILYIHEAPVDTLSYISLGRATKEWQKRSFVALCGLSREPIDRILEDYPYINTLIFCLDNDDDKAENKGKNTFERLKPIYEAKGYHVKSDFPPTGDWNEVLVRERTESNG